MSSLAGFFEESMIRFATSGTLITVYLVADLMARRQGLAKITPHPPRWVHPFVFVSVTAFYLLIGPTGGPIAGGYGNLAGVVLVLAACAMRFSRQVRYPELAGRGLLYVALPLAVGVPWGWLALSVPAYAVSMYCARRADRLLAAAPESPLRGLPARRMVPGVW
jgi:hypothetical protein